MSKTGTPYAEPFHVRARRVLREIEQLRQEFGRDRLTFEGYALKHIERELRDVVRRSVQS